MENGALLRLPPELIQRIMFYLGPAYFREDVRRLTVSKEWFAFAQAVLIGHLYLSDQHLERLMSSPGLERTFTRICNTLHTLDISLQGFQNWEDIPNLPQLIDPNAIIGPIDDVDVYTRSPAVEGWTKSLGENANRFFSAVTKSRKLRTLRLQARAEVSPSPFLFWPQRSYLSSITVNVGLSLESLTELELDLVGTGLFPKLQPENEDHVCRRISALLCSLRRLHLRLRSLCPSVLELPSGSINTRLEEVIVNLSLLGSTTAHSFKIPVRCESHESYKQLEMEIIDRAKILAMQMTSPKVVRVLIPKFREFTMQSIDILTGNRTIIHPDAAWDEDGKSMEEASRPATPECELSSISNIPSPSGE